MVRESGLFPQYQKKKEPLGSWLKNVHNITLWAQRWRPYIAAAVIGRDV
ncbi:MAG: hypothetical protein RLZZ143_1450 [Cyanobacteriota bacterium]|jgi:hypothetical protein